MLRISLKLFMCPLLTCINCYREKKNTVASGDDEPSIFADCPVPTSSLSSPEVGYSLTTLSPSQSDSMPLDIGILLNNGTLSTLPQSMKLKLLNHTPDVKYKCPTKYVNGCNR